MSKPEAESLQLALRDLEFGDFDKKIEALICINRLSPGQIMKLDDLIKSLFSQASGLGNQLIGAAKLAKHNVRCTPVVPILLHALETFSDDPQTGERVGRFHAIEALSFIKDDPRVVEVLHKLHQFGSGWDEEKNFALWALGAIGNPQSRSLLEYAASNNNTSAKAALRWFGTGSFRQIQGEASKMAQDEASQIESKNSKSGPCFVATAVYQNDQSPEVVILRSFREVYLRSSFVGNVIIAMYERIGPRLGAYVAKDLMLRALAKGVLQWLVAGIRRLPGLTHDHP